MSTRDSIWYHPPIHVYVELIDHLIYAEIGRAVLPIWITRRWLADRPWSGTFFCRFGWHPWWMNSFPERGAQKPDGTYELNGKTTWRCLKCGRITE